MLTILDGPAAAVPFASRNTTELPSGIQLGPTALNSPAGSDAWRAAIRGDHIQAGGCSGSPPEKAICFPSGDQRGKIAPCRNRGGQLQFLGSVNPAAPQNAVGISHIGHPLPIGRKANVGNRGTLQVRKELSRLGVVANQFGTRLFAYSVDFFPSALGCGPLKLIGPEVNRTGRWSTL